ncbi:PTS sugar transporter subunit IIA [Jannaschia donghaensis]|uniref:PTS system mannose-specific transporter subunits IIAB n=1 Tax=Jannaschia donghaensis TaxID=420998 RepID=A0A0M6YI91_9RHOB|nr:PTS fructose transporter subunit IIA [Jannaschia donghaensis]CTQ50071.1 PTS system mannose-specific transporter subunits IIAB [Jannaschia donghaensis]
MIGIVIVAHGGLAEEYRRAVEHVMGPQKGLRAVSVAAMCDRASKEREIQVIADSVDQGDGVVIVTDIFGGSPSNLSMGACAPSDRKIFYGANLPALIKLARSRTKPLDEALALAKAAGTRYMDVAQGPAA